MKKRSWGRSILRWTGIIIGMVALLAVGYFASQNGWLTPILGSTGTTTGAARAARFQRGTGAGGAGASTQASDPEAESGSGGTVPVRSAESTVGTVSAAGNLA